jgi:hypothetical protein
MDVTKELLGDLADPLYHPLPPSIDELVNYADELEYEGHCLTIQWATNEIKNYSLGFIRVGLLADKVRRFKLYRMANEKYANFREYCEQCLGKTQWHINRLIEAAKIVLELARAGFAYLPQNEAQARPLTKLWGDELIAKWQEVLDTAPKHRITANHVAQIVDPDYVPASQAIRVDSKFYKELEEKARESGMSAAQLVKKLVQEYEPEVEPPPIEETPGGEVIAPVSEKLKQIKSDGKKKQPLSVKAIADWVEDMKLLLIEHYGFESLDLSSSPLPGYS